MTSVRRMLTLFRIHKYRIYSLVILSLTIIYLLFKWNILCTNFEARQQANKMCKYFREQRALGTLCGPVCLNGEIKSLTCHTSGFANEAAFSLELKNTRLVFKSVSTTNKPLHWFENGILKYPSEKQFLSMVQTLIKNRLHLTLSPNALSRLTRLNFSSDETERMLRQEEMNSVWNLVHNNEFLMSALYSNRDIFPQLLGTCGSFFAVEHLESLEEASSLLTHSDSKDAFIRKIRTAIQILELLEELETGFQEPFYLCDVKLHHFGLVKATNKLKLMNLEGIFPYSVINKILSHSQWCEKDEDCDVYDCRSRCIKEYNKCANFLGNDNLQIVCEKIFLGWRLSSRVIVPGLLMSEHTPEELAVILRQCARPENENGQVRSSPEKELKERLGNILIQIEENASNDVSFYQI